MERKKKRILTTIAVALALSVMLLAAQPAFGETGDGNGVFAPFEEWYTAIVGTDMIFSAEEEMVKVKSRRENIAKVTIEDGHAVVTPLATGDTSIGVLYASGDWTVFDVYVYASQPEYDYLAGVFGGKTVSILGDSLSTLEPYDTGPSRYYDKNLISDCGSDGRSIKNIGIMCKDIYWGNILRRFGARLGVDEASRGTTVVKSMESDKRIDRLGGKGTPDIIIFYGGTNDAKLKVGLKKYAAAYKNVLTKLQKRYPEARILALLPCYPAGRVGSYNARAIKACDAKDVEYVNLANTSVRVLHPGAKGFSEEVSYILDTMYAHSIA